MDTKFDFLYPDTLATFSPIIIVGMHRSGTSLLARLFMDLGIHMGCRLSRDAEAIYFQRINRTIYRSQNAYWDQPHNLNEAMRSNRFIETQTQHLRQRITDKSLILGNQPGLSQHFGRKMWAHMIDNPHMAWGWKDPRTSLVIPIWANIFPQAKWIHIVRNGIDVSISLYRRSWKQQRRWIYHLYRFDYSEKTLNFQYCFNLWEEYLCSIYTGLSNIDNNRKIDIKYEELLQRPEEILNRLMSFVDIPIPEEVVRQASEQVNQGNIDSSQKMDIFSTQITSLPASYWMKLLGYSV
jgi:hypothetical protein